MGNILIRSFMITLVWFGAWITFGAIIGDTKGAVGFFFIAYLTGFALPWLVPEKFLQRGK